MGDCPLAPSLPGKGHPRWSGTLGSVSCGLSGDARGLHSGAAVLEVAVARAENPHRDTQTSVGVCGLLHILLRLIGLLLLLLQIILHAGIGLGLTIRICLRIARGTRWQSAMALILRELGKAIVHLFVQVVVHVLQVLYADGNLRSGGAIAALAALDLHVYVLV